MSQTPKWDNLIQSSILHVPAPQVLIRRYPPAESPTSAQPQLSLLRRHLQFGDQLLSNANPSFSPWATPMTRTNIEPEWWGWTLPETKRVLLSFDHLAQLIAPEDTIRVPGGNFKAPGEVRGRVRTLQMIVRGAVFEKRGGYDREVIKAHLQRMKQPLESFLGREVATDLLGRTGTSLDGKEAIRRQGASAQVELKRRRDALSIEKRERFLVLVNELEERVEVDLRAVEDVVWPRRVIQFGSRPSEAKNVSRLELVWEWLLELGEELLEYASPWWMCIVIGVLILLALLAMVCVGRG